VWTDNKGIEYKSSADGVNWGCPASSTVPTGSAPCTAYGTIPNPAGVNTTEMPWIDAGAGGIADVVFYGANGPVAGDNNNIANTGNVHTAQTTEAVGS